MFEKQSNHLVHQTASHNTHARNKVRIVLEEQLRRRRDPAVVHQFLRSDWQNIMFFRLQDYGESSEEWLSSIQLCSDLLWSVQPHTDKKSLQRLEHLLTELYQHITIGFGQYPSNNSGWQKRFAEIKSIHNYILAHNFKILSEFSLSSTGDNDSAYNNKNDKTDTSKWQAANDDAKEIKHLPSFKSIATIKKLREGHWLQLNGESDGPYFCKIVAYVEADQSYQLVNTRGAKIGLYTVSALAERLETNQLTISKEPPLLNKAISSISARLRKL